MDFYVPREWVEMHVSEFIEFMEKEPFDYKRTLWAGGYQEIYHPYKGHVATIDENNLRAYVSNKILRKEKTKWEKPRLKVWKQVDESVTILKRVQYYNLI